jgi:hypothetical protein
VQLGGVPVIPEGQLGVPAPMLGPQWGLWNSDWPAFPACA